MLGVFGAMLQVVPEARGGMLVACFTSFVQVDAHSGEESRRLSFADIAFPDEEQLADTRWLTNMN